MAVYVYIYTNQLPELKRASEEEEGRGVIRDEKGEQG